jgi:hypothetical protein
MRRLFVASAIVLASFGLAGPAYAPAWWLTTDPEGQGVSSSCKVLDVGILENRVHIHCDLGFRQIYFAVDSKKHPQFSSQVVEGGLSGLQRNKPVCV